MLLLCLDSSAVASVAVVETGSAGGAQTPRILAQWDTQDTRSHAEVLSPAIEQVITESGIHSRQLDAVLVGTGPGPFTGLRAGLATARALGFGWGLPVYGMPSLHAVAHDVATTPEHRRPSEFVVATDARRRELYWAVYQTCTVGSYTARAELSDGPFVGSPADVADLPVYGYGASLYAQQLTRPVLEPVTGARLTTPASQWQPCAAALGLAAGVLLSCGGALSTDTTPLYLRESDAKVPAFRKKATS
ncbi:MAG: tRNA (adenosine(37)-N6)-threonylcarbamoyltransferase complex dimerization subunit type 1 TsaB [Kocuria sp.]|nr:tRNA (adenosine(37)-N6)-threonylcarbamoyltransferase complex dimerization subunit type 1 TsaB [Kocuria sp.]